MNEVLTFSDCIIKVIWILQSGLLGTLVSFREINPQYWLRRSFLLWYYCTKLILLILPNCRYSKRIVK